MLQALPKALQTKRQWLNCIHQIRATSQELHVIYTTYKSTWGNVAAMSEQECLYETQQ